MTCKTDEDLPGLSIITNLCYIHTTPNCKCVIYTSYANKKLLVKCCLSTLNDNLHTSFEPIFTPEIVLIPITATDINHEYERHKCMQFHADDIHYNN